MGKRTSIRTTRRPRPQTRRPGFVLMRTVEDAEFDGLDDWMAACPAGELQ